ncbi:TELO2-interacting protein 1 homolog [Drosophila tropicalis]|uniref:TELO2-interacting protein 1 homolog n=1 Tax=Drosophila tropicalis TaxID=46794 RepID=UPI0035ABDF10
MLHLERYVTRIKPAIEGFIQQPSKDTLRQVEREIEGFNFGEMRVYQVHTLVPLVVKLDDLSGENQELRTSLMNCLRNIISHMYLSDEKGLRSILVVVLQQVRDSKAAVLRPNLSEEIKLAAVSCIVEALRRSTTDVLEAFYGKDAVVIIGQILLTLLELIEREKYRKLVQSALDCLMVLFYVHDEADPVDVVLRSQVANTIFIFLPKVLVVLFKTSLKDDKVGESIKSSAVKALGRIICIMFEETTDEYFKLRYDVAAFRELFLSSSENFVERNDYVYFGSRKSSAQENEERLEQMQTELRSPNWVSATAQRLRTIFVDTSILRAHSSIKVRSAYADMCCMLITHCSHNLQHNFIHILESVVALSQDEDATIAERCRQTLSDLQQRTTCKGIFEETAELLLDTYLNKWPRILQRCEENEQFALLLFFKGFLSNVSVEKLQVLLLVPKNLEMFVTCLLMGLRLLSTRDLLKEDYTLHSVQDNKSRNKVKLIWRQFKYLTSQRCIEALFDILILLGTEPLLNRLFFDYGLELIEQRSASMNECILMLTVMITPRHREARDSRLVLADLLLEQLLRDEHWQLALQPDAAWRLKVNKPSHWFEDRTPGLYTSAVEVRTQDCDSDDEDDQVSCRVTILDAQFNVLHTCLVLDSVGHCASFIGDTFDRHIFRSLYKILLKLANNNTYVQQAATFAFVSMQLALKYAEPSHFIECSTDYLTFHLNALLKRSPESSAAVDILTVILQYSTKCNVPHLDSIFQTIQEECAKVHQTDNVYSYLRVFNAFLKHVSSWKNDTTNEINEMPMQIDTEPEQEQSIYTTWLNVLKKPMSELLEPPERANINPEEKIEKSDAEAASETEAEPSKPVLPRHIEMTKEILSQVIKFLPNSEQSQQILALECLSTGVPILSEYENELLPLIHLIWQPLMEKFRQKDALVLNRCFSLLHLMGVHAKDFILKRSLSDVVPQLKQFLWAASNHSCLETSKAQTQEYKLQLKLLHSLSDFIQGLQVDGKHLHELLDTVALYLSETQPKELQSLAGQCFQQLVPYNGPFIYITLLQRAHLKDYKVNVDSILKAMGFSTANEIEIDYT